MAVKCQFDRSIDEVWALLCDPDFRVERSIACLLYTSPSPRDS